MMKKTIEGKTLVKKKKIRIKSILQNSRNLYKKLLSCPSISTGRIIRKKNDVIQVTYSQIDIINDCSHRFVKNYTSLSDNNNNNNDNDDDDIDEIGRPIIIGNEKYFMSPSRKYRVQFNDQSIIVWSDKKLERVIEFEKETHGNVVLNTPFVNISWSKDESSFCYVAEKVKERKNDLWDDFDSLYDDESNEVFRNSKMKFDYDRGNFGEGLTEVKNPKIFICYWKKKIIEKVNGIPNYLACAHPIFSPCGKQVLFLAYRISKRYPSLRFRITCQKNQFYQVDLESGNLKELLKEEFNIISPRISPDGLKMVFLSVDYTKAHFSCERLMCYYFKNKSCEVIVDVVPFTKTKEEFPGIYAFEQSISKTRGELRQNCWSRDSNFVYINGIWRNVNSIYKIGINEKSLVRIEPQTKNCSLSTLDIYRDVILAYESSPIIPFNILVGCYKDDEFVWNEVESYKSFVDERFIDMLNGVEFSTEVFHPKEEPKNIPVDLIFIKQKHCEKKLPLIMNIHGGPHSCYLSDYQFLRLFYVCSGFILCIPNYRGSVGFGEDGIKSLFGKVGQLDASDIVESTEYACSKSYVDKQRIGYLGGSHGGYLGLLLIGKYPDLYQVCVVGSPVTNRLDRPFSQREDPKLSYHAVGFDYKIGSIPTEELVVDLFDASPFKYIGNVKAPVLILSGSADTRVNVSQSIGFYKTLKLRNVKCKLKIYPKESHIISSPFKLSDRDLSTLLWLKRFLY